MFYVRFLLGLFLFICEHMWVCVGSSAYVCKNGGKIRGGCVGVLVSDQYLASAEQDSGLLLLWKEVDRSAPSPYSLADSFCFPNPNQNIIASKRLPWISEWELNSPFPFSHCPLVNGNHSLVRALIYQSNSPHPPPPLPKRIKDGFQKYIQQDKLNCPPGFFTSHRHTLAIILEVAIHASVSPIRLFSVFLVPCRGTMHGH